MKKTQKVIEGEFYPIGEGYYSKRFFGFNVQGFLVRGQIFVHKDCDHPIDKIVLYPKDQNYEPER